MIVAILTCYNEAATLKSALECLLTELKNVGEDFRIIIVDDGSTDGSQKIYDEFVRKNGGKIEVVRFEQNRGVGEVFKAGFARAIEVAKSDDDVVVIVEADGTNELALIGRMRDEIKQGAGLVIASRYSNGSVITGMPQHRVALSRLLNIYLRNRFKKFARIHDFSYFFKAISAGAIRRAGEQYKNNFITSKGFAASAELVIKILRFGVKSVELPTKYFYQSRSKSKLKILATIKEYISLMRRLKGEIAQ